MDEANCGVPARQERGWKLFVLLPRLLLFRHARGGNLGKEKFAKRYDMFVDGEWAELFRCSRKCAEDMASLNRRRQRRVHADPLVKRVEKATMLVQVGELSSARQALEGAELAPGSNATLTALKDPSKRPPVPRDPLPRDISEFMPVREFFELEEHRFARNLRSSRRGAAAGPSGMTMEHLRPLLDCPPATHSFFLMAEQFSKAMIPRSFVDGLRMGRITALQKPNGGVRGIVAGDAIRRLVSRTIAQQLGPAVEKATAPHQYAMTTKAGCECIAHVLQSVCESNPQSTVVSVDGVSAFDLISRESMLHGLMRVAGGGEVLPFVRQFYGQPSQYLWEDANGVTHTIPQGEGGEQGDAVMPLLYSLGQHSALEAIQRQLLPSERLFAYLDDICAITPDPERVGPIYAAMQNELWVHSCVRIDGGKTQVWNAAGQKPGVCEAMDQVARGLNPEANVWRGSELPTHKQGIKVLGTPVGHPDYVAAQLEKIMEKQHTFLQRIPSIPDLQSAWLLLLHCASPRANYLLRVLPPDGVLRYAQVHDERLWQCFCRLLSIAPDQCDRIAASSSTLPMSLGGLGLRSAARTSAPAYWASWADTLPMIHQRHPVVVEDMVSWLNRRVDIPCLRAAAAAADQLTGVSGFSPPSWEALVSGVRPPPHEPDDNEPGCSRFGWQHEASSEGGTP